MIFDDLSSFELDGNDLESLGSLGRGAYGDVEKMRHRPSGKIMAVKVSDYYTLVVCINRCALTYDLMQKLLVNGKILGNATFTLHKYRFCFLPSDAMYCLCVANHVRREF